MRNFEKIYLVIRFQLSQSLKNKRIYLGFALGLAMILRTAFNYLAFTGEHSFCVAEPWLQNFMTIGGLTVLFLGYMITISDAPFVNESSILLIYRTGRKCWLVGIWLYLVVQWMMYCGLLMLAGSIPVITHSYINDIWGRRMTMATMQDDITAISVLGIYLPENMRFFEQLSPWKASVIATSLFMLYCLLFATIMFSINLLKQDRTGTAIAGVVYVLGFVLQGFSFISPYLLYGSLLANMCLDYHLSENIPIAFSYVLFLILLVGSVCMSVKAVQKADLAIASGEMD